MRKRCWWLLVLVLGVGASAQPAAAQATVNCGPEVRPYLRVAATYREAGPLGGVLTYRRQQLTLVCADRRARGASVNVWDPEEGPFAPFGLIAEGMVTRNAWSAVRAAARQATIASAASCFTAEPPDDFFVEFRVQITWYGAGRENTFVITNQDDSLPSCDAPRETLLEAIWDATRDHGWENAEIAWVY
jgi:hypothetical protein